MDLVNGWIEMESAPGVGFAKPGMSVSKLLESVSLRPGSGLRPLGRKMAYYLMLKDAGLLST